MFAAWTAQIKKQRRWKLGRNAVAMEKQRLAEEAERKVR